MPLLAVVLVASPLRINKLEPCLWLVTDSQLRKQRVAERQHWTANNHWGTP